MVQGEIKRALVTAIKKAYPSIEIKDIKIERTKDLRFGDYTTNICLKIASTLSEDAYIISEEVVKGIRSSSFSAEAVSGFINFKLADDYYQRQITKILTEKDNYAKQNILKGKKIQVEYLSANPTGPFHLGNARGGYTGDPIANVVERLGAKVEREYYLNDAGAQIETLGKSALLAAGLIPEEEDLYCGNYIEKWIKGKKGELKKNIDNPYKIGQKFARDILTSIIKPTAKDMKIKFDTFYSEKNLKTVGAIEKTLKDFEKKDLIYEEEGAKWFKASEFGDNNDHVVMRSDGTHSYYLADIAYHRNKFVERKYDKVINTMGADHHSHVARTQAAVKALGHGGKLDVVLTQFVRLIKGGKEYKMSKRKGTYVSIDDLFELIGGSKSEASDVVRFFFLSRDTNTHMDFDLDLAKEHSEKNPVFYVKYAYARISGILKKAGIVSTRGIDLSLLTHEKEMELIKELIKLPEILIAIAADRTYPVHHLTFYARSIAQKFHSFYDACRVIDKENPKLTKSRLALVKATQIVLSIVMKDLIGIDAPERM